MTPERWQQVKSTLAGALEREDTRERTSFLEQECAGDLELEREVRSLLEQPTDHFDECAASIGFAGGTSLAAANVGRRVGNYELQRELGRGGMGTVWLARRADAQFEKLVAVKLLKRGTDTDEVLRRFNAERQILARLEHPNIARLLDGGTTDDDLPYFVMEYVDGVRLTDFVRERQPTLKARLQLFLKICSAVQLAHQNLVVHRDLKPGNILVTAEGEPKLLDFGIAKLLGTGGEAWEMTLAGRERLTPGYASPEQVRGKPVTTVSDVYSLGALLYEVLTERPAHSFGETDPTPTEVSRVVCDEEPLRPSLAATAPEMRRQLRGDLDTIIGRALAKLPARRYSSVGDLAADLQRYLHGRPVRARSDSVAYRARKFALRNKVAVTAAALVIAAVIAGAASTIWQARRAERRFNDVRKIANSFLFEFYDSIKLLPGTLNARRLLTTRAVEYLDTLAEEAGDDLSLQSELANGYERVAAISFGVGPAIETLRKAVALNEAVAAAAPQNVAYGVQRAEGYRTFSNMLKVAGRSEEAIEYAQRGLTAMQPLVGRMSANEEPELTLGHHHMTLAVALAEAGDFRRAMQSNLAAIELQENAPRKPNDSHALRDLAASYGRLSDDYADAGETDRAVASARRELDIISPIYEADSSRILYQRNVWAGHLRLARHLARSGDHEAALKHYDNAVTLMEGLAAADPDDKGHRRWLAVTYSGLSEVRAAMGEKAQAIALQEKAIAMSEELASADAQHVESRGDLATMYAAAGSLLMSDQPERALEFFRRAQSVGEALIEQDPNNTRYPSSLATALIGIGDYHLRKVAQPDVSPRDRTAALTSARDSYERALGLWQKNGARGMLTSADSRKADAARSLFAELDAAAASEAGAKQ